MFHISFDSEKDHFYEEIWPCVPQIGSFIHFPSKDHPEDDEYDDVFEVTQVYHAYTEDRSKVLVFMKG